MNASLVVGALEFAIEHRRELAADCEAAIHLIRRLEHMVVKHDTTADAILMAAEEAFAQVAVKDKSQSLMGSSTLRAGSSSVDN